MNEPPTSTEKDRWRQPSRCGECGEKLPPPIRKADVTNRCPACTALVPTAAEPSKPIVATVVEPRTTRTASSSKTSKRVRQAAGNVAKIMRTTTAVSINWVLKLVDRFGWPRFAGALTVLLVLVVTGLRGCGASDQPELVQAQAAVEDTLEVDPSTDRRRNKGKPKPQEDISWTRSASHDLKTDPNYGSANRFIYSKCAGVVPEPNLTRTIGGMVISAGFKQMSQDRYTELARDAFEGHDDPAKALAALRLRVAAD